MKRHDIHHGMTVYHTVYTHWGPGVVKEVILRDSLESVFEKGSSSVRVIVDFVGTSGIARMRPSELRVTPNRRKIQQMVKLYQGRGIAAKDGGDRLVLPADYAKQ